MPPFETTGLSADEIAENLERERANLAQTIDGLRDRLASDTLISDVLGYAKTNIAPYTKALDGAVRSNPMAAVMVGVGLAWLVLGRKSVPARPSAGAKLASMSRWENEGGPAAPTPDHDDIWMDESDKLRDRASDALARIDAVARQYLRPVAEIAQDRARVLADLAVATRTAMAQGLDHLASDAREQILAAREHAYVARNATARMGTKLIEERPVLAGAIGMAIGAALASALPQTETEDRLFGQERDRLMARAQEVVRLEQARAANTAARLVDTVAAEVNDSARQLVSETL